jgi:LmbE family N-acetylglucosaminyl deacetylase
MSGRQLLLTVVAIVTALLAGPIAVAQDVTIQPPPGTFAFSEQGSVTLTVTLEESDRAAMFKWPSSSATWDTAMLEAWVTTDPAAPSPFVEIVSGGASGRQYLAAGESGPRWLNLSSLRALVKPGAEVVLRGDGVTIANRSAVLRLFSGGPDLSKTILVLAPHPDDAEIAAFGLYANRRSTVVTVTAGNAGSPTYEAVFDDPAEQYLFKGRIRVIDSITVPWQGGIPPERTFNMGYFDARLAGMYDKREEAIPEMYRPNTDVNVYRRENIGSLLPKRSRESTWENLVDDTLTLLKKVKPAVIVAPHPQLDTHRDHQYTTVALAEALARWKKDVTLLLYTNHADSNRYPYGPAGTILSLPPPVQVGDVRFDRVYSHPVTPQLQRLKLFALESMHDLRYTPTRQYQLAKGDERATTPEKVGPEPDITYLRRGPRSNELFFVYDQDSVKPMIQTFLDAARKRAVNR